MFERGCVKTGIDALKKAIFDLDVDVLLYVPGYPVTETAQSLGAKAQMAVNEKVALETALGASVTGQRSLVLVKHLGVNLLADPLSISPTHTIGAGLVVLVGEDVGPHGSQIELDVRHYGSLCQIPVLDPSGSKFLYQALVEAYLLSEKIRSPVMVRSTFKLDEGLEEELNLFTANPHRDVSSDGGAFDPSIWDLTARGRHQKRLRDVLPLMIEASDTSSLNFSQKIGDVGIIASGRPARLAVGLEISLLVVGYAHPLPWSRIKRFIESHRKVLVVEEPFPFIESQLRMSKNVCGKLTGHLPFGELNSCHLKRALDHIDQFVEQTYHLQTAQERGSRKICDDCPYCVLYQVIGSFGVSVAGDAGCSIRAVRSPFNVVDVVYGLGSSIGVASGFKEKGIAIIGDYAFIHSGVQGLLNAVFQKRDVLVVLLQNDVAAMTGGQRVSDVVSLLEAIVSPVTMLNLPMSRETIESILKSELISPGVSVVVARGKCPRYL